MKDPEPALRTLLRLGAYQIAYCRTPPHAAVSTTVALAPNRQRVRQRCTASRGHRPVVPRRGHPAELPGLDRRAPGGGAGRRRRPCRARAHERAAAGHGAGRRVRAGPRIAMGRRPRRRPPDERVADLCAAPGGKATRPGRDRCDRGRCRPASGTGRSSWWRNATASASATVAWWWRPTPPPRRSRRTGFDQVLVDAPCSGLGALRRRPDARWRMRTADIEGLAGAAGRDADRRRAAWCARAAARATACAP